VKWASVTLAALHLTGCASSQLVRQDRTSSTQVIRQQAAASQPEYAYSSLVAALQQWGERVTLSIRSEQAIRACRETLMTAAAPYRPESVEVAGAGPVRRTRQGTATVLIEARVTYDWGRGTEVRQGRITCQLNDSNIVVALR
jgi:hypothetical protein